MVHPLVVVFLILIQQTSVSGAVKEVFDPVQLPAQANSEEPLQTLQAVKLHSDRIEQAVSEILSEDITLPSRPRHPRIFFRHLSKFLKPRVYFKPITWYTEMHHVRTFFFCVASWLFRIM